MPIIGITASSNQTIKLTDFIQIATTTIGVGGASEITFSSIPQAYTHLQLRMSARGSIGDSLQIFAQFNSDTGGNYSNHFLYADGATFAAAGYGTTSYCAIGNMPGSSSAANIFGATVTEILDYKNTNKFKTTRGLSGADRNGTLGYCFVPSSNWRSTSAITSIRIFGESSANFTQNSVFSLYGIQG